MVSKRPKMVNSIHSVHDHEFIHSWLGCVCWTKSKDNNKIHSCVKKGEATNRMIDYFPQILKTRQNKPKKRNATNGTIINY